MLPLLILLLTTALSRGLLQTSLVYSHHTAVTIITLLFVYPNIESSTELSNFVSYDSPSALHLPCKICQWQQCVYNYFVQQYRFGIYFPLKSISPHLYRGNKIPKIEKTYFDAYHFLYPGPNVMLRCEVYYVRFEICDKHLTLISSIFYV